MALRSSARSSVIVAILVAGSFAYRTISSAEGRLCSPAMRALLSVLVRFDQLGEIAEPYLAGPRPRDVVVGDEHDATRDLEARDALAQRGSQIVRRRVGASGRHHRRRDQLAEL